jgi:hypothetical protein
MTDAFPGASFPYTGIPDATTKWPGSRGGSPAEIRASDFVTKDAGGNVNIGAAAVGRRLTVGTSSDGNGIQITFGAAPTGANGGSLVWNAIRNSGAFEDVVELKTIITDGSATFSADLAIGQARSGAFQSRWRFTSLGHLIPATANFSELGSSPLPMKGGWTQSAFTVTCDADKKKRGAGLSPAEIRAGKRIAAELCWWQWLDRVAERGDDARRHFGPMAQDIGRIFVEEGVEADYKDGRPSFRSDMLGWDEWNEVTRPVMAKRKIKTKKSMLVEIEGSDDGTGQQLYRREKRTVDETEEYETGETEVVQPAGSGWVIDPTQVAFFLIATINADTETRLLLLESGQQ